MNLELRKIKSDTVSTVSPSVSHEVMGPDAFPLGQVFLFVCLFVLSLKHYWRRRWQPTPVFFPGESHGQPDYRPRYHKESNTTKQLSHTEHYSQLGNKGAPWHRRPNVHRAGVGSGPQDYHLPCDRSQFILWICSLTSQIKNTWNAKLRSSSCHFLGSWGSLHHFPGVSRREST